MAIDFLAVRLLELGEVNVSDAGTDFVFEVDGGVRDLVAHQVENQRLRLSFANHRYLNVSAFGPFRDLATRSEVMPSVGLPSIAEMMSPGRMPARNDGVPS